MSGFLAKLVLVLVAVNLLLEFLPATSASLLHGINTFPKHHLV
jgi:hypothetical protein